MWGIAGPGKPQALPGSTKPQPPLDLWSAPQHPATSYNVAYCHMLQRRQEGQGGKVTHSPMFTQPE